MFKISNAIKGLTIASLIKEVYSKLNSGIREEFKDADLTVPQIMVISILSKKGKQKISDISEEMYLTNGTVSGIIDRLGKQNIVSRIRSKEDKRVVYVELTEEGQKISKNFKNVIDHYFNNLFFDSSLEDLETIIEGLKILKNIVDKQ